MRGEGTDERLACRLDRSPAPFVRFGSRSGRLLLPFGQETPPDASVSAIVVFKTSLAPDSGRGFK